MTTDNFRTLVEETLQEHYRLRQLEAPELHPIVHAHSSSTHQRYFQHDKEGTYIRWGRYYPTCTVNPPFPAFPDNTGGFLLCDLFCFSLLVLVVHTFVLNEPVWRYDLHPFLFSYVKYRHTFYFLHGKPVAFDVFQNHIKTLISEGEFLNDQ